MVSWNKDDSISFCDVYSKKKTTTKPNRYYEELRIFLSYVLRILFPKYDKLILYGTNKRLHFSENYS